MSLNFTIPHRNKFLSTGNIFNATFSNPTVGEYDFTNGNNKQIVFPLDKTSIYLVERMAIGGNISEENYLNSILTLPQITFRLALTNEIIYTKSVPVVNYYNDRQATTFIHTDKAGDSLTAELTGVLNQISDTVGKSVISLTLTLSVYQIDLKSFNEWFKSTQQGVSPW